MSQALYEKQNVLLELYQKLGEAETESESNTTKIYHKQLMENED